MSALTSSGPLLKSCSSMGSPASPCASSRCRASIAGPWVTLSRSPRRTASGVPYAPPHPARVAIAVNGRSTNAMRRVTARRLARTHEPPAPVDPALETREEQLLEQDSDDQDHEDHGHH